MSELITLPRQPTPEMIQAIEDYYSTRLKYKGKKGDAFKADCWMALMAYYAMIEAYEKANQLPMIVPIGTRFIEATPPDRFSCEACKNGGVCMCYIPERDSPTCR